MDRAEADALVAPLATRLDQDKMAFFGIAATMRIAEAYNRACYGQHEALRRRLYRESCQELLDENGPLTRPRCQLHDGWAIDTSMSLPHLDRILEQGDAIIAERAGRSLKKPGAYRSYFQDLWIPDYDTRFPAFLDFATSSDVLAAVADYLQTIPALTVTFPPGVRLIESNAAYDPEPHIFKDSQLFHVDYYSVPSVYVLVLLRDTTEKSGPWTFIPKAASARAAAQLHNWGKGVGYRFTDEQIYSVVDRSEAIEFVGPRGSVLFIDASACFHYGSRNAIQPRLQFMLSYNCGIRSDFAEIITPLRLHPVYPTDSRLRRLVVDRYNLEPAGG